jgi:hypothetical protein
MSGWIKIHRSILNHWLYTENRKFSKFEAWQDLLLNVNYTDCKTIIKGKLYDVKRGQSILSLDSWAKRWSWDKSSVRRFFNLLEKDKMILVKSDNITTHLTICKYEDYQQKENANETLTKRKRNTDEIQTTPIEESKEYKEEKESNNIPDFDTFLNHALSKEPNIDEVELKKKYDAWANNDWHDGNGKKIIIWKTKLNSTIPYISKKQSKKEVDKQFFKITL